MNCPDASSVGCEGIARVVSECNNILRGYVELLQGMKEEIGGTLGLPHLLTFHICTTDTVDFVFWENIVQVACLDRHVQHLTTVARHDGCLDVVVDDELEHLLPAIIGLAGLDVCHILFAGLMPLGGKPAQTSVAE